MPLDGALASTSYSEQWVQDLLYRFPHALPAAEIDASFAGLIPACREMNTSAGAIDVLYVTPNGRLVLLEAKLWRNPESRRKVIGQILDYAKELSKWKYETLDAAVRAARRAESRDPKASSLYDIVKAKRR